MAETVLFPQYGLNATTFLRCHDEDDIDKIKILEMSGWIKHTPDNFLVVHPLIDQICQNELLQDFQDECENFVQKYYSEFDNLSAEERGQQWYQRLVIAANAADFLKDIEGAHSKKAGELCFNEEWYADSLRFLEKHWEKYSALNPDLEPMVAAESLLFISLTAQLAFDFNAGLFYEKIYKTIMDNIDKKGPIIKRLFHIALNTKIKNYEKYGKLTHAFFDPIFFNKIRNLFGGEIKWILSGGATLQKDIFMGLRVMVSCPLIEGYGQTENAGSALLCSIYDTTGGALGGVQNTTELKLVDLPEYNYFSTDINPVTGVNEPRGELCFRGGTVFKGYFKNAEETKKLFDKDGWLHSSDVGVILTNKGNAIKIIDREKNLFKLNQGEFIAPDKVQAILTKSKYINQIFVYGENQYSYSVALVYPELKQCIENLKENKKWGNINYDEINIIDLYGNKIVEEIILKDCDNTGRKFGLKGFEIPKKLRIIKEPFSQENNSMTPTMKLKRKIIKMKYSSEIKSMYNEE